MSRQPSQTQIRWHGSLDEPCNALATHIAASAPRPVSVVPSSLAASDRAASSLRAAMRQCGVRTTVLLPRSAMPALFLGRGESIWREIHAVDRHWRIDARLRHASYAIVANVDEALRKGPFVLDLPARFLHPADRLSLATRPDRERVLADIAASALPALTVVVTPVAGGWLQLLTDDAIAAELWSLALAERYLDRRLEMRGPWEDATVQRATELELGARFPGDMRTYIREVTNLPPEARKLLYSIHTRLGLTPLWG